MPKNPFVTSGYEGPEYFCDREEETEKLTRLLANGNNVVLMSPRRMGKTGLLYHAFQQEEISMEYHTFIIDIYSTKNMNDMVAEMGKEILNTLQSRNKKAFDKFVRVATSLRPGVSFDPWGNPTWNVEVGNIQNADNTLEQIFDYIKQSDQPCLVAIDEFQQIAHYPEKNVEAILRTYIQHCCNANFVFSGSERHLLAEMFSSPSRPFYASTSTLNLGSISPLRYDEFARAHFEKAGKHLAEGVVEAICNRFEGVTWYMQKVLNYLFADTASGETCEMDMIDVAVNEIVKDNGTIYADLLYQLTAKQKELLVAISKEGKVKAVTGSKFIKKHYLTAASSVQTTVRSLMDKQLVTSHLGIYEVYDKFFGIWLSRL
ncbi:MAG: ATP-binding protein [Bacteroidales bacterium]|nr:ATP-binding protein [Bacteroidales bacterium]